MGFKLCIHDETRDHVIVMCRVRVVRDLQELLARRGLAASMDIFQPQESAVTDWALSGHAEVPGPGRSTDALPVAGSLVERLRAMQQAVAQLEATVADDLEDRHRRALQVFSSEKLGSMAEYCRTHPMSRISVVEA